MDSIPLPVFPPAIPGKVYIYALVDPRTDAIRYVGKTRDPQARWRGHLKIESSAASDHKKAWLRQLKRLELRPIFRVLEVVLEANWVERERWHIANQHALGARLTNGTDGGEGGSFTEEAIAKLRAAKLGKKMPREAVEKTAAALRGRPMLPHVREVLASPEVIAKRAEKRRGSKASEETRARMTQAHRGRKHSPETIEKVRAAKRAYWASLTEEDRAQRQAYLVGKTRTPEQRANISAGRRGVHGKGIDQ